MPGLYTGIVEFDGHVIMSSSQNPGFYIMIYKLKITQKINTHQRVFGNWMKLHVHIEFVRKNALLD